MEIKFKPIYLFYKVTLQPISGIRSVIVKFLCHTDTHTKTNTTGHLQLQT